MEMKRLKCNEIKEGQFSNEKLIFVNELQNGSVPFLVPEDIVSGSSITVQVFEKDGKMWAVIPTEYPKAIPVDQQLLQPVS